MIKLKNIIKEYQVPYHIYCDMDGVLTDFDLHFSKISPTKVKTGYEFEKQYGQQKFWSLIDSYGLEWWTEMPWMPEGKKLWKYLQKIDPYVEILSAPTRHVEVSGKGKRIWVERELGRDVKLNLVKADYKMLFAKDNNILIDDLEKNIKDWNAAGGIGIQFQSTSQVITGLQHLGLFDD